MATTKGPYVHLDLSFHQNRTTKFDYTFDDSDASIGSSVKSGLRNSLHSSYNFDLSSFEGLDDDHDSFGGESSSSLSDEDIPSWRLDPAGSGSDWTILIESVPDNTIVEYPVHKRVLTKGSKKSDYFVTFFNLSEEQKVDDAEPPIIQIHANAACLMEPMLDFLYSSRDDDLEITTETAVGLRHLSEFFGIRALCRQVVAFLYEDVKVDTMRTYLLHAAAFDDLPTQKLCARRCSEEIHSIDPYSDLLVDMDPSFLLDVIASPMADRSRCSAHMSKLVSVYCQLHRETMDGNVFEELTSVEYLPVVGVDCALDMLLVEADLVEAASDATPAPTYLQKRCIEALAPLVQYEIRTTPKTHKERRQKLARLPKKVLVELLAPSFGAPC